MQPMQAIIHGFVVAAMLLPSLACATEVALVGLMGSKAVVTIDGGQQKILSPGQRTPEGVKLVSVGTADASFEIDGKLRRVGLGESAFQTAVMAPELRPKGGSAVIAADSTGRFVTHMQVNGFDTEGVVDFKTSLITLNTNEAKRLGVDVRSASRALASKTGGLAPIYRVKLKQLRIGGITLENIEAVVNEGPNPPVIVLGSNILNRLEVKREGSSLLLSKPY